MSPKLLVQALSVIAILVLSGCAGQNPGKTASTSSVPVIAPPAGVDESTCGLEGFVGDDSFAPIAGADVGIEGTEEITRTAQDGRFTFSFLQPGRLSVVVSALGYETETRKVPCEAGSKITDLVFSLKELPKVGEQYIKRINLAGRIGCAFGFGGTLGFNGKSDLCGKDAGLPTPPVDPQAKASFPFQLDPGVVTGAVVEMKWQRTGTFGAEYLMLESKLGFIDRSKDKAPMKPKFCSGTEPYVLAEGRELNVVFGKSKMCYSVAVPVEGEELLIAAGPKDFREIAVRPSDKVLDGTTPNDRSSKLVFQQPFEIWASFFYHGLPIEDGYSAFEE